MSLNRATRQKHCPMALRGAIVGQHLAGSSFVDISRSLNVSVKTAKRWVNRHRNINSLERMPQPGQKRKLNPVQRDEVVEKIQNDPFTNAAIVGREYAVNKNTIRKIWIDAGIYHGIAVKKPKLTTAHKEARMGYALENLTRDWSNVVFSDEKTYQTDRHQKLHVYRPKNSRFQDRYIHERQRSGRISAGYWGWISRDGPGELVPIGGRLNSNGYVSILEDTLKPSMEICYGGFENMIFMQLASCRVVREAPATDTITLKDLTTKAETAFTTLHDNVLKFANVSSDDELRNMVRTQSETYAEKLKTFANEFTDEFKANSDKFDGFFKSFVDSFTQTANELKSKNPELASFQDTIEKGIKNVLDESQKFNERLKEDGAGISENAQKILKKVYEDTLQTAKTVSVQLATATSSAKKD